MVAVVVKFFCYLSPSDASTRIVSTSACPSILLSRTMKPCHFLVPCILSFIWAQGAVSGQKVSRSTGNSAISSSTRTQPKSSAKVPTGYLTHKSHSTTGSTTRSQKTHPGHTIMPPKSSGKGQVPTRASYPTASSKTTVRPTIRTTSDQKPKSPISRGSNPASGPAKTPESSPPPATTSANSTTRTTQNSSRTLTSITSASKTLTVSKGQTASAQVGWMVVGVGVGGAVAVGDSVLPVAGGTKGIIIEDSSGQDELSTISDTSTTPTTTSRSSSKSSSTSSSTANPTPYNIYPKLDSGPAQQSAFARNLKQIAQPGSVRRITGSRDQLLLWVASLTPAQASELSRNPVVSAIHILVGCYDII